MESLKAPAPCGLEGSRRHVTDRFRIAPARDATGIAARRAVGPACPASSLRCPQARVCALSCVRTPLNVIETAPIRGTRHREPLPHEWPKSPFAPREQPSRGPKVCPVSVVFELKLPQNVALGPQ